MEAGADRIEQSSFSDDANSQSKSPRELEREQKQDKDQNDFKNAFLGASASDRDRIFSENLSSVSLEFALQTLSDWTRPNSGQDSKSDNDELIDVKDFENVSFRVPHSFDHGKIVELATSYAIAPYLNLAFNRRQFKVVSFFGERLTRNAFQKLIPPSYQADGGAMKVIRRNRQDEPTGLKNLLSAYANSTLVVIGHIVTLNSTQFIEITDDKRPGRSYLLKVEELQKSAFENQITLVLLGCGTGGFSSIGTNSPSGQISSMDAVRNVAGAINADIPTMGALLSRLAGQNYTISLSWTAAIGAYQAAHGENSVIGFDFLPRGMPAAPPPASNTPGNFISQGATDSALLQAVSTNPVTYEISMVFGRWLNLVVLWSFLAGMILTVIGDLGLFLSALIVLTSPLFLLGMIRDREERKEILPLFAKAAGLALTAASFYFLGSGLCDDFGAVHHDVPISFDFFLYNVVVSFAFIAALLLPCWVLVKRPSAPLDLKSFCAFGVCWLVLAPILSVGPIYLMATAGVLDPRYLTDAVFH